MSVSEPSPASSAGRRGGFTLLELMISLTVGGIAISSIYAIGAASARQFQQQQQIANAQSTLRLALNQVKRDISRAGYLGTPWANAPGQSCAPANPPLEAPGVSGRLGGISRFTNDIAIDSSNSGVDPSGNNRANGFTVDEVVMFGNYETSAEYPGLALIGPTQISVSQRWQSFQRDFTDWYTAAPTGFNAAAFNDAFTVGRAIRIQTIKGLRHFAQITAITAPASPTAPVLVSFNPGVPTNCQTEVQDGWVAPMSAIRYVVQNAAGGGDPVAQLLRQEVLPTDKVTPLPNNPAPTRAILDYVVGFNLAFTLNGAKVALQADNYTPSSSTNSDTFVNANTEKARAVTIDLAVRAPQQDPSLPWTQAGCANMRCFQISAAPGAARVRRMRAEVFLPNIAYENY